VKQTLVTTELLVFFGLEDDDDSCGKSCLQVLQDLCIEWPRPAYDEDSAPEDRASQDPASKHYGLYVVPDAPATCSQEKLVCEGFAVPLLYTSLKRNCPQVRALALQLFMTGSDTLLAGQGYSFCASPDTSRVVHPLLGLQILTLHPHMEFYAAVLAYIPKASGRYSHPLHSAFVVKKKLVHFLTQTMGMRTMKLEETERVLVEPPAAGHAELFAHQDTLHHGKDNSRRQRTQKYVKILGRFEFVPRRWYMRNMKYGEGARKTTPGSKTRTIVDYTVG
jgi:hypothetical protein